MTEYAVVAVHWLHILTGITWFGGYVFLDFIVLPALIQLPAGPGQLAQERIFARAKTIMAFVGPAVVLLGILRGTLLGSITSVAVLFGSSYGWLWMTSLTLAVALMLWGAVLHGRFVGEMWDAEAIRPAARDRIRTSRRIEMTAFSLILLCMVLMRFGI